MKLILTPVILTFCLLLCLTGTRAQNSNSAAKTAETLRQQLLDVQAKEAELKARLQQLDEDLKPENIERYFAGVGSTRPEELREERRRQLTIQKDGVNKQLAILETSRARLEASIAEADSKAYQQSAQGFAANLVDRIGAGHIIGPKLLVAIVCSIVLLLIGLVVVIRSRYTRSSM